VPDRSADDIQRDIERARTELAQAVDQLAYRTNPKRLVESTRRTLAEKAKSPAGQAAIAVVGGLLAVVIIRRIRKH
jgi:hypothetical protein